MRSVRVPLMATGMVLVMVSAASAANQLWWSNYLAPAGLSVVDLAGTTVTQPVGPGVATGGTTADLARGRIIYADYAADRIVSVKPDGSDPQVLASTAGPVPGGVGSIYGVTFDTRRQRVYWSDDDTKSVYYVSTADPSVGGLLHDGNADYVESPAYDVVSDRVYWANFTAGTIESIKPDGSGFSSVTPTGSCTTNTNIYSVIVDAAGGTLYFTGSADKLQRASLDGSGCADLAGVIGSASYGLALDKDAGRVYWTNFNSDEIGYTDVTTNAATVASASWSGIALNGPSYPAITKTPAATSKAVTPAVAKVGDTLTCDVTWNPGVTGAFEYRSPQGTPSIAWSRGGTPITGATSATLVADTPGTYTCAQTATNVAGSTKVEASASVSGSALPPGVASTTSLRVTAKAIKRVRQGATVKLLITTANSGGVPATDVTTCVTLGKGFSARKQRAVTIRKGVACWRAAALPTASSIRKRLTLKAARKPGKVRFTIGAQASNAPKATRAFTTIVR